MPVSDACVLRFRLFALLMAGTAPSLAHAQNASSAIPIIVIGHRPVYVVPERTLGEGDIAAYGVSDVGELISQIASENGETPEEPIILVNGKRVGSLGDISNYPPEVVSEVQVLPRGAATRIGSSPDRRVYNIVLRRNANVLVGRAGLRAATEGNWTGRQGDVTYTQIHGERRINGAVRVHDDDALLESERDIIEPVGSPEDLGRFRTLQPRSRGFQLSLSGSDRLSSWLTGTGSVKLSSNTQRSLLGLTGFDLPLARRARTLEGAVDLSLDAEVGSWLISWGGAYDYNRQRTLTEGLADLGRGTTTTVTTNGNSDLTASGPLFDIPAGQVRLSLGADLSRDSVNGGEPPNPMLSADRLVEWKEEVNAGVDIPLASRANHVLPALGELTASIQLRRAHVAGFGWLNNQTFALTWQPARWLRLFGSITAGKTPPDVASLAAPLLETPGVIYFDPLRNETLDVSELSGGNPDLVAPSATSHRLSANLKPFKSLPLQLTVEYSSVRDRDIITVLPPASDLIILAFPERFVRDAHGMLTSVDVRPVQFAREDQDQLHYGINLNLPLGSSSSEVRPSGPAAATQGSDNDDGATGATSQSNAQSAHPRMQLNLSHTLLLKSDLQIRPGLNPVDLLSPDAIGIGGAGRPRNQLDFSIGYAERSLGVRFAGQYRSKSYFRLVGDGQTDVLRFSPLATFSIRAWAEPTRFFPTAQWLKGSRLSLSVVNIADQRQTVRNSAGVTPLAYQPAYRDPLGRTIEIELRKVF